MITISFLLIVGSLCWTPYATSLVSICGARIVLGAGAQIQLGNPLVIDYVHKSSRGVATIVQNAGWIIGEVLAFAVLFNLTKAWELKYSFFLTAATLRTIGLVMICLTTEHVTKKRRLAAAEGQ